MLIRWFYLHFRKAPAQKTLDLLLENGLILEQVFETSYDVASPLSYSAVKHLLKSQCPDEEYNLVKVKDASEIAPLKD